DFHMIFSDQIDSTKLCEIAKHTIDTGDAKPFKEINQRIPVHWNETISMEIDRLQKNGTIRESNSPWCSRIVPIKKEDGSLRLCIDFRRLNLITIKDSYPLPRIDEIIDKLVGSTYFTVLDATSGYNQIAIREEDIQKTAFAFNNGFYEYTRMPFGLCNAPATFQRVMDKILCKRTRCFVLPYLDDVIVFSKTLAEHNQHVRIVLEKIKGANITLNKKKCKFFQTEIKILGTIIAGNKVKPDPGKIEAIKKYPLPQKIQQLRAFLGLANYVRAYIKNYASISAKLCEILKGETKRSIKQIEWSEGAIECFKRLKQAVINITYRSQPDISKEFILTTDASSTGIGAVLSQINKNGSEEMICAFSKKLDKAQMNYSVTDRELLAVVKGIDNFRHYLLGKPFSLRTDHKALEYLWKAKNPTGRFLRWGLKLQEYTFTPIYIKGDDNFADGLSRYNDTSCIKALAIEDYTLTKDTRSNILKSLHYESGHGSKKTMELMTEGKYNWEGLKQDIREITENCLTCKKVGSKRRNTKNKPTVVHSPNELWECDLIGRLETKEGGNKFIFVAIDHYTKWLEAKVIKNKTGKEIAEAIRELIIDKHGSPMKILTDNGLEFLNEDVKRLAEEHLIELKHNSPDHHESMGLVERANQTLFRKLQKISEFGAKGWERHVQAAAWAYNISFNRVLYTSPYIFKFGKTPELCIDKEYGKKQLEVELTKLRELRDKKYPRYASRDIVKGKQVCFNDYKSGDKVLVYKKSPGKFSADWHEGYTIHSKVHEDAFIVSKNGKLYRLNKKYLKLEKKGGETHLVGECRG
ncbi:MAG: reverse transcriptase domain-containing protein, partial [Bacteroidales bacterium]